MLDQLIPGVHNMFLENEVPMWVKAGFYGFVSSVALPLGSIMGMYMHPIDKRKCALVVAFGAGALIFAVSTELYAESLRQVEHEGSDMAVLEIGVSMMCAVFGAVLFTVLNQKMEEWSGHADPHSDDEEASSEARAVEVQKAAAAAAAAPAGGKKDKNTPRDKMKAAMGKIKTMNSMKSFRGRIKLEKNLDEEGDMAQAKSVALALWLGVALDGIPESILIGFITNEKAMTVAFLVSIFIANFPESFSSSSMLKGAGMGGWPILGLWTSLCVLTTLLSAFAAYLIPQDLHHADNAHLQTPVLLFGAAVEGLAGGAMMAMVWATMLPEAYKEGGRWSGLCAVLGFLASCTVKVYFGRAAGGNTEAAGAVVDTHVVVDAANAVEDGVGDVVGAGLMQVAQITQHFLGRNKMH